jgi:hypothetical protein
LDRAIRDADYQKIVRRIRAVQMTSGFMGNTGGNPDDTEAAQVAEFVAARIQRALARLLAIKPVYFTSRIAYRTARLMRRLVSKQRV